MKTTIYKNLVKSKMKDFAFYELTFRKKKGEKGRSILYNSLCMADYLLPEANLTVSEKVQIFSLRSEMNDNPCNFGEKIQCQMGCSQIQENLHILNCPKLNEPEDTLNIEEIRNDPLHTKIEVLRKFNENMNRITQHLRDSVNTVNPL